MKITDDDAEKLWSAFAKGQPKRMDYSAFREALRKLEEPPLRGIGGLRQTRTYAVMEVSAPVYQEIAGKLREAEYSHAFIGDGETDQLDMHGIALQVAP